MVYSRWSKKFLLFTMYCALTVALGGCQNQSLHRQTRVMMGTFVEVVSPDKSAITVVFEEIKRIEELLSKYREANEVSRLNKFGKLQVGPELLYVLRKSEDFWLMSDGAFDITVGPLMDLWGFTDKKYRLPSKEEIKKTLVAVGFDKIIFHPGNNVIEFKIPGMKIDLGAIAKGYAVDCAINKLKKHGINRCLINAGGDIYCLGKKFNAPWKVAIQNPRQEGVLGSLELSDKAVVTSGDYAQYFTQDNKRFSHILNPKTGYPAASGVISVTVIAPDCLTADALATTIFVLGKTKGEELAKKFKDVEVKIVENN